MVKEGEYIFPLQKLHSTLIERRKNIGLSGELNRTRLKEKLIMHFGDECQEQLSVRSIVLVFNTSLSDLLKDVQTSQQYEADALAMTQLAYVIQQDVFNTPA